MNPEVVFAVLVKEAMARQVEKRAFGEAPPPAPPMPQQAAPQPPQPGLLRRGANAVGRGLMTAGKVGLAAGAAYGGARMMQGAMGRMGGAAAGAVPRTPPPGMPAPNAPAPAQGNFGGLNASEGLQRPARTLKPAYAPPAPANDTVAVPGFRSKVGSEKAAALIRRIRNR